LTLVGRQIVERTFAPFQILLGVAAIYFAICYSLSRLGRYGEQRMRHAH
jgi:ABC-type amino acid transport system permease subunit